MQKNGREILTVKGLNSGYGNIQVLWDVDIKIDSGNITALVGANGAGKTTLFRVISGLLKPYSGEVTFKDRNIINDPPGKRASQGIMMIPEGRQLFRGLSVKANLMMGAYTRKDKKEEILKDLDWVYSVLPILKKRKNQLAGTISGGEAQMCAIGRGLMANPKLLLIDELSLGLAPVVVDSLVDILSRIHSERDITVFLVDQDVQTALEIATYGYVIANGKVEMEGASEELLESSEIQKAFFGI